MGKATAFHVCTLGDKRREKKRVASNKAATIHREGHGWVILFGSLSHNSQLDNFYTLEPPITDPPTSGQPLYNRHWLWHQMKLLQN